MIMLQPVLAPLAPPPVWAVVQNPEPEQSLQATAPLEMPHQAAIAPAELTFTVVAALRAHPHLSNVLTHISRGNWGQIEQAFGAILNPDTHSTRLSALARNIVDLMCADRGVTGRIFKPYYQDLLSAILGKSVARRLIVNITSLFIELERETAQAALNMTAQAAQTTDDKPDQAGSKS
jgi:hypothetical protein